MERDSWQMKEFVRSIERGLRKKREEQKKLQRDEFPLGERGERQRHYGERREKVEHKREGERERKEKKRKR